MDNTSNYHHPRLATGPSYQAYYAASNNYQGNRQYQPNMSFLPWNGMMGQNQYPGYYSEHLNQPPSNFSPYDTSYYHPHNAYKSQSQNVFQNPLHYQENSYNNSYSTQNTHQNMQQNYMNPYPKQSFIPQKQGNVKNFMNSFKSQDGSLDFNKMMDTAGMMMNAMNQVTGLVKGVGGIFKV